MPFSFFRICILRVVSTLALLFVLWAVPTCAQSTDVRSPTPVDGNEIVGAIPARDIGDSRSTDHFYTFNGLPGDLLITVESRNLNCDFDVFTAAELRPVLKVVAYAESTTAVTKNIYLRKPESLILRVEGRTPNDDEGTYRIRFSGSFAPVTRPLNGESRPPEEAMPESSRSDDRKTTRVTSAGARIEEPRAEVAVAPTPEPAAASTPAESTASPARTATARGPRARRPPARKTVAKPKSDQPAEKESPVRDSKSSDEDTAVTTKPPVEDSVVKSKTPERPAKRATERRTATKSGRGNTRTAKAAVTAENGQLVIEVNDGTRVEYSMSTVAKVTIENGEVVIVNNDGYIKRVPLANILRMSIGP